SLLADEAAVGEEHLANLALVQVAAQFVVCDAQTHAVRFIHNRLLHDHALRRALHQVGHELLGNVALELLFTNQSRLLRNLLNIDFLACDLGQYALRSETAAEIVPEQTSGNKSNDHHHADNDQN